MSTFKQQLLDDLIVVELSEPPQDVIKLPDWQRVLQGRVIGVGPGRMLNDGTRGPMETRFGDLVSFNASAGMDTSFGGRVNLRIMKDTDVDAVLEPVQA